ncbi:prolactin-releasing peptide receptor [Aplysia californica]|uniref:Prolactin-releasing peptide receptor n=1 Tax=Aplysia californica TaxID=6500 RepID=A0ABM1VV72_APLCA|nr:prolactin-releasing peptide receptor [Aplysia californica]
MLVAVVLLFLACWTPLLTFNLVTMEDNHIHATSDLMNTKYYLQCLALSSAAYNPIIYAFLNQKFRTNFKSLLLRRRGQVAPLVSERAAIKYTKQGNKPLILGPTAQSNEAKTQTTQETMAMFTTTQNATVSSSTYGRSRYGVDTMNTTTTTAF